MKIKLNKRILVHKEVTSGFEIPYEESYICKIIKQNEPIIAYMRERHIQEEINTSIAVEHITVRENITKNNEKQKKLSNAQPKSKN